MELMWMQLFKNFLPVAVGGLLFAGNLQNGDFLQMIFVKNVEIQPFCSIRNNEI